MIVIATGDSACADLDTYHISPVQNRNSKVNIFFVVKSYCSLYIFMPVVLLQENKFVIQVRRY